MSFKTVKKLLNFFCFTYKRNTVTCYDINIIQKLLVILRMMNQCWLCSFTVSWIPREKHKGNGVYVVLWKLEKIPALFQGGMTLSQKCLSFIFHWLKCGLSHCCYITHHLTVQCLISTN